MSDHNEFSATTDMRSFVGKTLRDSYFLREYIHEGNFGAVFKSEQQFLGVPVRRVAVKVSKHKNIDLSTAKDIFADAFLLAEAMDEMTDIEARSHLVHIYDVGILPQVDNRLYVVMEYIQGTTLATQFESLQRVPMNLLLKWAHQICVGLSGLHSLVPPVIHRDLKPDNILLGYDNHVRVVDFGLAARLLHHGYVPGVAGTVTYMAPETTKGESVPASDVYSLGVLMYEGLTGRHPFAQLIPPLDLPAALQSDWLYKQKSTVRPTPPSHFNNTITLKFDSLILRCLEFNPGRRFHNASELLNDLVQTNQPLVPSEAALEEGRRLHAEKRVDDARKRLEKALTLQCPVSARFELLRELGGVLVSAGEYKAATERLVEAWKLTQNSAILRTRAERADILKRIASAYRKSGNSFQAANYDKLSAQELSGANR